MCASTYRPPRPIAEVREETREWLNHVCNEQFGGNVRRMATSLGYNDAGRSKLDRILKGKTLKIDSSLLEDLKAYLKEQGIEFLDTDAPGYAYATGQGDVSLKYCTVEVAYRNGQYVAEKSERGRYRIDPIEIGEADVDGDELFVVPVVGDSMDPEFRSGDRIIIEPVDMPTYQMIPGDGVYLYRLEESIQVKRLMKKPKNRIQVVSANSEYETYDFDASDKDIDIEIIGRVWARVKRY
jgi:phage repressor protein C with HTH and peptisase S24 domain